MSLTSHIRNLKIVYPEHQNLLSQTDKEIVQFLEVELGKIKKVSDNNKNICLQGLIITQIKPFTHFVIKIDNSKDDSPYCFIYDAKSKHPDEKVASDIIKNIIKPATKIILQDRVSKFAMNLKLSDFSVIPNANFTVQNKVETSSYRGWDVKGGLKL